MAAMSKVAVGFIPEKISYVYSKEEDVTIGCSWDISWYDDEEYPNKTIKVSPAFPVDSADDKTMPKAISWASQGGYYYETRKPIVHPHTIDEVVNEPIKGVKILRLEERGNGGRAYKALIGKYYVDLREDVMMDTLLQVGVDPGGILKGEYVWAKLGSQMKLIRIGSELHRLVVEFESKKDIKPVGKKDLEVGGVYRDRKKNKAIFIGYVNTVKFKKEKAPDWNSRKTSKATFTYETVAYKKLMLFYEIPSYDKLAKVVKEIKSKDSTYYFKTKKSHTYIEKIDQVTIPNDLVEFIRNKALKDVKNSLLEFTGHNPPKPGYYQKCDDWHLTSVVSYNSEHLNIYPFEGPVVEPFDVKKFLLFS